jgi:LacI family transcriptional regulator
LSRGDVDGVLFNAREDLIPEILQQLRALSGFGDRPIVVYLAAAEGCSTVLADDFTGGYLLADHLLKLGHRRLLRLYSGTGRVSLERAAGCRKACLDQGCNPENILVSKALDKFDQVITDEQLFQMTLREMFTRHPDITAILSPNDHYVPYIWRWLQAQGFRVPEDVSLTGFDDATPLLDGRNENILTTIRVPLEEIGRQAATLLVDLITGHVTEEAHLTLPVTLVTRRSTAPPRTQQILPL